jgi:hypothetical protein
LPRFAGIPYAEELDALTDVAASEEADVATRGDSPPSPLRRDDKGLVGWILTFGLG